MLTDTGNTGGQSGLDSEKQLKNENAILEPHETWTKRTTMMVVIDFVAKPFLVLFIIVNILFLYWRILPGDPVAIFISGYMQANFTVATNYVWQLWGFDLPLSSQYALFLFNCFSGQLFRTLSFTEGYRPVGEIISARFPNTLILVLLPFLIVSVVFVLFYWFRRGKEAPILGVWGYLYQILFSKSLWILLALLFFWGALQLGLIGVLPLGGTHSVPLFDPLVQALDFGWHLIAPATIVALLSMAVATHYFHQAPGESISPLSHGLPRLLLWTVSIAIPIEVFYNWYGIGRVLLDFTFLNNYPGLLAVLVTYIFAFGLAALFLEGVLRWGIYRNPVEFHGQHIIPTEKTTIRRPYIMIGVILVCIFIGLAIAGQFIFTSEPWPRTAPLEYSLMGLFPLLMEGVTVALIATLIGGLLGLGANFALRSGLSWPINYLPAFIFSLIVITLSILPIIPALYIEPWGQLTFTVGLLLSAGAIRKISNTELGEGSMAIRAWAKTLFPLFILYFLAGGAIALIGGFIGIHYTHNLGWVILDLLQSGVLTLNPFVLLIPGTLIFFFIFTFDFLWDELRQISITTTTVLDTETTPDLE
jgi:ABC-type dipeptide/oligopeptide/nickel transport system permease component